MKVDYDAKVDALYIALAEGNYDHTRQITKAIMADVTADGQVIGIEILNASHNIRHFNPSDWKVNLRLRS